MIISVLSGKGGAGKTLVSVNLAAAFAEAGKRITYIDCDVEEPNGRLFLKPENVKNQEAHVLLPEFDGEKCKGCRKCVDFCRFNALIYIKDKPVVFDEVCHSCGGCAMVCPQGAISERIHSIGQIEKGTHGDINVYTGILNIGEVSGVPLIHQLQAQGLKEQGIIVVDCPPGSACSVMESVTDADFCLLVVEPTAFGFHNFKMVHQLVKLLEKPFGVVVNKAEEGYELLDEFCAGEKIEILQRIPYSQELAALSAGGEIIYEKAPLAKALFDELLDEIVRATGGEL